MGSVRMTVSGYLLREVLHMPQTATFIAASVPWSDYGDQVEFIVADDAIPGDIREPIIADPIVRRIPAVPESYEWDWNLPRAYSLTPEELANQSRTLGGQEEGGSE